MDDEVIAGEKISFRIGAVRTLSKEFRGIVFEKRFDDLHTAEIEHPCPSELMFIEDALREARLLRKTLITKLIT
ncbi:hypothetical protein [Undibacterium terreum]|uniref:Uncharacterized protein n=1 Tax=Undibacterium terreum TaxID=1224302 RepID=A0A916U892_9BURK|nr:hypothetical protein [Undibacterium terreum]GGC64277.1 hypothetical protein GCM10011396_09040 [Undibacterium terreum]